LCFYRGISKQGKYYKALKCLVDRSDRRGKTKDIFFYFYKKKFMEKTTLGNIENQQEVIFEISSSKRVLIFVLQDNYLYIFKIYAFNLKVYFNSK
jgi:hypothetical protein